MKISRKIIQLSLISVGVFLILGTYYFYPKISKEKPQENKVVEKGIIETDDGTDDDKSNLFENVEYKGFYDFDKPFTVQSEKAFILEEKPEIVYMTNMSVTLHMSDGKIVVITSDEGSYDKVSYDCTFVGNVVAKDGETTILADNLDLITSKDFVTIYNNVVLNSDGGSLKADKVDYNFETKYYHISMFNDKKVKVKLIQ